MVSLCSFPLLRSTSHLTLTLHPFLTVPDGLSKLKCANPSSKEEGESFSDLLYTELIKKQSSKPGFEKHFVPHFFRNAASTLRDVDIRKTSALLKTYAEEKVKAEKEAKKSGGQKKIASAKPKAVGTASAKNVIDTRACKFSSSSLCPQRNTDRLKDLIVLTPSALSCFTVLALANRNRWRRSPR